jgi:hypothetical protein
VKALPILPALLALALVAGCGGDGDEDFGTVPPPLVPSPQLAAPLAGVDPDQNPEASSDVSATVTSLGGGRYRLLVQNGSDVGFVNSFEWTPPAGVTVTGVTRSSTGRCELDAGAISCRATLRPPKCTCRPGGQMTIEFAARVPQSADTQYGVAGGFVKIRELTPVPYLIPSAPDQQLPPEADLPLCAGEESTNEKPCLPSGAGAVP